MLARLCDLPPLNSGVCGAEWIEKPGGDEIVVAESGDRRADRARATASRTRPDYEQAVARRAGGFPAGADARARGGEIVRQLGNALRERKGRSGPARHARSRQDSLSEGEGEVQEMIDMCDFAVGLSRQLYGLTIASERPQPPDVRAVASAGAGRRDHGVQFSRRRVGLERGARRGLRRHGDLEASHSTPLTAIAVQNIVDRVLRAGMACRRASICASATRDDRRADGGRRAVAADLGDRQLRDGPAASAAAVAQRLGPHAARTRRQQRDDRHASRPISIWRCGPCCSPPSAPPASAARRCAG